MNYITFDLELERPSSEKEAPDSSIPYEKIISIGVVIGTISGEILHKEDIFIQYEHPLSAFIKQLTHIKDEQLKPENGAITIVEAWNKIASLQKRYGTGRILLMWGGGDFECLLKEVKEANPQAENPFGRSGLNVKHLHRVWCEANGINASGGLAKSLGRHGMQFEGQKHSSVSDALNTYRIYLKLMGYMKGGANGK